MTQQEWCTHHCSPLQSQGSNILRDLTYKYMFIPKERTIWGKLTFQVRDYKAVWPKMASIWEIKNPNGAFTKPITLFETLWQAQIHQWFAVTIMLVWSCFKWWGNLKHYPTWTLHALLRYTNIKECQHLNLHTDGMGVVGWSRWLWNWRTKTGVVTRCGLWETFSQWHYYTYVHTPHTHRHGDEVKERYLRFLRRSTQRHGK